MKTVSRNVIGPRLRRLRRARGLTITDLVMRLGDAGLGLDTRALTGIEARTRRVRDYEVLALARALGVRVAEMFPRSRRPKS